MNELIFLRCVAIVGALVSLFMALKPQGAVNITARILEWKIKWCGFEGKIKPTARIEKVIRIQCSILAIIFVILAVFINF